MGCRSRSLLQKTKVCLCHVSSDNSRAFSDQACIQPPLKHVPLCLELSTFAVFGSIMQS